MNNPQLSRKEEIEKGCGKEAGCGTLFKRLSKDKVEDVYALCPTCQARLDERIRAEQDFLRLIDEEISKQKKIYEEMKEARTTRMKNNSSVSWGMRDALNKIENYNELKSTIQKETKK
jgi:hypothetical protein